MGIGKAQGSVEWFEARKGRITGSVVGAILDIAPYMTREQALRTMVRSYHGADSEFNGNIATEWGNANEDGARWEYELETGNTVKPAFFDTLEDWIECAVVSVAGNFLVEIHIPFGIRTNEKPKFKSIKDIPYKYAKIQVDLFLSGFNTAHFFQWTPHGTRLEVVEKDQQWIDDNLPVLRQFYAFYLSELDNPEHLEPLRKEINTEHTKLLLDEYDQLQEAMDNAKERLDEVKADIIAATGDHNALMWGRKVTKVDKKGSVSYAKVVKDHAKGVDLEPYRGQGSVSWKIT